MELICKNLHIQSPGCARGEGRPRRSLRRHLRGHESIACRLSKMEGAHPPRSRTRKSAPTSVVSQGGPADRINVLL